MRRFMISFMPAIGLILIVSAIRTVVFGFQIFPFFGYRMLFLGVATCYLLIAYAAWRLFIFYYKKKPVPPQNTSMLGL